MYRFLRANSSEVLAVLITLSLFLILPVLAKASSLRYSQRSDVNAFIQEMVQQHHFKAETLEALFDKVASNPKIIARMTHPYEKVTWGKYRRIFLGHSRARAGAQFWIKHNAALKRASQRYGVPPEIILAIIGVESHYGQHKGKFRIIDALSTLAFDFPRRSKYFKSELAEYLLMARRNKFDPLTLKGSYAGAMGYPQFMPSSYRYYAVDFDHNGQRDLLNSEVDAIGSVANYFAKHHWQPGHSVAVPAKTAKNFESTGLRTLKFNSTRRRYSLKELQHKGFSTALPIVEKKKAKLIPLALETQSGPEYWVGLPNFYVITRYNTSTLYAMAVFQLSEMIKQAHAQMLAASHPVAASVTMKQSKSAHSTQNVTTSEKKTHRTASTSTQHAKSKAAQPKPAQPASNMKHARAKAQAAPNHKQKTKAKPTSKTTHQSEKLTRAHKRSVSAQLAHHKTNASAQAARKAKQYKHTA